MYWRPITEETPEDWNYVIVTHEGPYGPLVTDAQYRRLGTMDNVVHKFFNSNDDEIRNVTAWMPYPIPYREPHQEPGEFEETAEMFIECTFCASCDECRFLNKCEKDNENGTENCKVRLAYIMQDLLDKMNNRFSEMSTEEFKEILCTM